jgi:hypothetical protein
MAKRYRAQPARFTASTPTRVVLERGGQRMTRFTVIPIAAALMLVGTLARDVSAQQPDTHDRTIMTFSAAVELPRLRLEPGTYVFRLADTSSRNVIQVLSRDEMEVLGQWLFVPAERQEVTGDTVVTFRETSAGAMPAIQFWFYPGEKIGKEFIYPKDQALRIAQRTGVSVLSDEGRVSAETADTVSADAGIADAEGATAVGTSGRERQRTADAVSGIGVVDGNGLPEDRAVGTTGQSNSSAVQNNQYAQNELPRTSSPFAIGSLLAALALGGAAAIRMFRM